jgi:putative hemolysin
MRRLLFVVLILAMSFVVACGAEPTPSPFDSPLEEPSTFESPLGVPNPASQFCEEQGYTLEMRTEAGGTTGYCLFPDGTECEEWAFYRGECGPGTLEP